MTRSGAEQARTGPGKVVSRGLLVWALPALLACFSLPGLVETLKVTRAYLTASPEMRFEARTSGWAGQIGTIEAVVPRDRAILLDLPQRNAELFVDRSLLYWLYPRPLLSAHALRMAGIDPAVVQKDLGISWVLGPEGTLAEVEPRTGRTLAEHPPAPDSPPPEPSAGAWLRALSSLLLFFLVGGAIVRATGLGRSLEDRLERWAVALLVGFFVCAAWTMLAFFVGLGVSRAVVLAPLAPAAILWLVFRRAPSGGGAAREGKRSERLAALLVLVLLGLLFLPALILPMSEGDERFQWAFKAKLMLTEPGLGSRYFTDPSTLHFHPRYPLLVPAAEALAGALAGGFDDRLVKFLFPAIFAAGLVVFRSGLVATGRGARAWVATLALLLVPFFCGFGIARDTAAAFSGFPDVILAVAVLGMVSYFVRAESAGDWRLHALASAFLVMAGLTKLEGKLHVAAFLIAAGAWLLLRRPGDGRRWSILAFYAAGAGVLVIHELAFGASVTAGILPDDYARLFGFGRLWEHAGNLPAIAAALARDAVSPRLGFFAIVLAAALLIGKRARSASERTLVWVPVSTVSMSAAGFCVPLVLIGSAWPGYADMSGARLLVQLVPLAYWAAFLSSLRRMPPPSSERPSGEG